jgi:uncharacterized membrane protein YbjE (DUF340 family)
MSASLFWLYLCVGLAVGWSRLVPNRFGAFLDRISAVALILLLAGMGAQIGADPRIIPLLGTMGKNAVLVSIFAMSGSVLAVLPFERKVLPQNTTKNEKPGEKTLSDGCEEAHAPGPGRFVEEGDHSEEALQSESTMKDRQLTGRDLAIRLIGIILGSVAAGVFAGYAFLPANSLGFLEILTSVALAALTLTIGIDLGQNRQTWVWLRSAGVRIIAIPALVVLGSLFGAFVAGTLIGLPHNESLAVGAGFGWYSLSGALISKIYRADTGALAFLANIARELGSTILMPLLARYGLRATVVAPGGATTMDTTLPLIVRLTDHETAVLALANGIILTILVPLLVPILINMK